MFKKFAETFSVLVLTLVLLMIIFVANSNTEQAPLQVPLYGDFFLEEPNHIDIVQLASVIQSSFVTNDNTGQNSVTLTQGFFLDDYHIDMIQTAFNKIVPFSFDELSISPQDILDCIYLMSEVISELFAPVENAISEIVRQFNDLPELSARLNSGANEVRMDVDHEVFTFINFEITPLWDSSVVSLSRGFSILIPGLEAFLMRG